MSFRIACLQFDSQHANVAANVAAVERLSQGLARKAKVDMLVLPELALTGYVFDSQYEIEPLLERLPSSGQDEAKVGPTLLLARNLARRHDAYVLAGVAELEHTPFPPSHDARPANTSDGSGHAYNSAILLDRSGQLIHTFRKHFLYDDDKRWASPGPGFSFVDIPELGRLCVGICMDLNPYDFTAPFEAYELANYCKENDVRVLVVPMAWLKSKGEHPVLAAINYWALRCTPLFDGASTRYLVAANRIGTEGKSTFAGASCALEMSDGRPELLGALREDEAVLFIEIRQR